MLKKYLEVYLFEINKFQKLFSFLKRNQCKAEISSRERELRGDFWANVTVRRHLALEEKMGVGKM